MFFTPWNENQNFRPDLSISGQPAPRKMELWDARDSDPRHLLPGWRCPVISRWRICQVFIFSSLESRNSVIWWNPFPALQCRLECEAGYVAQRTPLITCVNGEYAKGCHYLSLSHTRSTIVTLSLNWFQIWPTDCSTCIAQYYPIVTSVKGEM